MKKRYRAVLLSAATALMLSACAAGNNARQGADIAENEKQEWITVRTLNGSGVQIDREVPFDPERIAVLDMATLDILDNLGLGERVTGVPKGSRVEYLKEYMEDEEIVNLGTLKEVDMEALMASEPELIFIDGRLAGQYEELSEIAPVIYTEIDYERGLLESIKENAANIAAVFGAEDTAEAQTEAFTSRVEKIKEAAEGKTAVIGLMTSSNFNTLGNQSRASLIGKEAGFLNLADQVDSTHGNESSFELLTKLDPDYIFVLDRDSAINAEGARLAQELMENELVQQTIAHKNDQIVYLNPVAWYLAEGGITAMEIMLSDLEYALRI